MATGNMVNSSFSKEETGEDTILLDYLVRPV